MLAEDRPLEIVSADSRQVYKRLDIGTAKPTKADQALAAVHLIDLIEPGERYNAWRFVEEADRALHDIIARGKKPLLVGGTGLYLAALTRGVIELEEDDMAVRARLEAELSRDGAAALHARLAAIDPLEASKTHPNNSVRVMRALEIYELTGLPKSQAFLSRTHRRSDFQFAWYCLIPPREELYQRINERTQQMIEQGWLDEVRALADSGLAEAVQKTNIIGYSELLDVLAGRLSLDNAMAQIEQATRRYAKRQITWFRHTPDCRYLETPQQVAETITPLLA